ncbi:MarR family transcriptional regulator [Spirosoma endbachense]|uniref:Uncharacterized protein n=1 Tax=Spirosoma endbachense TaxID=2666025 RepID=A0A6P1VX13_9BACT|nr:MarR family transcriptional regulator [Spirosoma endbachense]QHV96327.1 hypothetical protein GJR95_15440 [Spirosoma endbachense]
MDSLWIDEVIMVLKRTPAEKLLLARICYRAGIMPDGLCRDSNKELSLAIDIHPQTVSDMVRALEKAELITTEIFQKQKNLRTIQPISKILIPYKNKANRYKEKADSHYKEIPYSPSESEQTLSGNSLDPISQILIPYKEFPDSLYKDRELIENQEENSIAASPSTHGREADLNSSENLPEEEKPPNPQPPLSPKKTYGDGTLQKSVKAFIKANPDKYPTGMYVDFLEKWTLLVDHAKNELDIGKEKWRTQDSWTLQTRLENWWPGYQKEQQKNEPATLNPQSTNYSPGQKGAGLAAGATKQLGFIPPGGLRRRGTAERDET